MKNYKSIIFFFFLCGLFFINAQEKKTEGGHESFNDFAFIEAQKKYLRKTNSKEKNAELYKRLGDTYYQNADYKNAVKWLEKWYAFSGKKEKEFVLKYAQSLKSIENYELANSILNTQADYLNTIKKNSGRFVIKKVAFNSKLSDFAPTFYGNNLVFSSNRNISSRDIHTWNNQPFLDLYITSFDSLGKSQKVEKINSRLNTKYHESTAVYTKDGNTVYFTRNNFSKGDYKVDEKGINRLKLYKGVKNDKGKWDIEELPFNSDSYSVAHPALSVDEKVLYFSSDMPGGKGKSDIYKVNLSGQYYYSGSTPENLGSTINTEGRDTFPFVSADNQLYFASEGHLGLGGLDVFVSEITPAGFGEVYNLGKPINSTQDDFTFIINSNTGTGFFASNRGETGSYDDIYSFTQTKELETVCEQSIVGVVKDKETGNVLQDVKLLLQNERGKTLSQTISNNKGVFDFEKLTCETKFRVKGVKDGFLSSEVEVMTSKINKGEITVKLGLESIKAIGTDLTTFLKLKRIYYAVNKDGVRPDSYSELQKVIDYMVAHPKVKIEVRSHTNSIGRDSYNMKRSEGIAKSIVDYIVKKGGVSFSKISGKGYGETQLKNECSNGVRCTRAKHLLNERIEFITVD